MASVLNEIAAETRGRAIIGLVSTADIALLRTFGITKIPTIFVLRDTEITASFVGLVPKEKIRQTLR